MKRSNASRHRTSKKSLKRRKRVSKRRAGAAILKSNLQDPLREMVPLKKQVRFTFPDHIREFDDSNESLNKYSNLFAKLKLPVLKVKQKTSRFFKNLTK